MFRKFTIQLHHAKKNQICVETACFEKAEIGTMHGKGREGQHRYLLERHGRAATHQRMKGKCSTSSSTEILYWRIHWVPSSSFPRCCNFLRAPRSSFRREERRGGPDPGLWGLVPKRHSLRNLPMINDRLAARSFKQQSFPREKISRIRSERSKGLFLDLPFMIAPCPHSLFSLF